MESELESEDRTESYFGVDKNVNRCNYNITKISVRTVN
jgi:hypothetical protein